MTKLSADQRGVIWWSLVAIAVAAIAVAGGWMWLPPVLFGLDPSMNEGQRLAFALKADLLVLIWLAGCVRAVSSGRFRSAADIKGSAFAPPSPAIAVKVAVLQNTLEQTVLATGGHLLLAVLMRGPELVLIPILVALYLAGRATFALGYSKGAVGRAFGMSLTGATTLIAYGVAIYLICIGR